MKWMFVAILVICLALMISADINDVRKNAIKKIDANVDNIKRLADETGLEVEKREPNIKIISKHEREFGDGILENTRFEISRTAKSAYMMANLLGSSNDVFRCIEFSERDFLTEIDKIYSQQFLDPGRDLETRAEQYQRDLIKAWKDDYYKAIAQYGDIYKRSVSEIQKSTSESYINSVVKDFESTTGQMANIILSIHNNMARAHIQVLKTLDQLVLKFQQNSRYRVDETTKKIQNCFPKFFQNEAFHDYVF